MKLLTLFNSIMNECPLAEVHYLQYHKERRQRLYPNVGVKCFTDYKEHKAWMLNETKLQTRREHNERILKEADDERKQA